MLPHRLVRHGDNKPVRLTRMGMQVSGNPEEQEIDLGRFGGQRISARGQAEDDEWVWGVTDISVLEGRADSAEEDWWRAPEAASAGS